MLRSILACLRGRDILNAMEDIGQLTEGMLEAY